MIELFQNLSPADKTRIAVISTLLMILVVSVLIVAIMDKRAERASRTTQRGRKCLLCGGHVNFPRSTGNLCTVCYVETKPSCQETETPKQPVKAIPVEVREDG